MADPFLKHCPFCGGPATFEECPQGSSTAVKSCTWTVGCANSEVDCIGYQMLAHYDRKADAAEAWNKRASAAPPETTFGNTALCQHGIMKISCPECSAAPEERTSEFSTADIIEHADYVHELANSVVSGIGQATGLRIERMLREFGALPSDSGKAAPDAWRDAVIKIIRLARVHINDAWEGPTAWVPEEEAKRLADAIAALAPATEGGGRDDGVVSEENVLRLIEEHFSPSQQKHFVAVSWAGGCETKKPRTAIRNFADAVLALSPSPSVEPPPPTWLGDEGGGP